MDCSMPVLPVLHYLLEFSQTDVIESMTPSNHLILCCPLLFLPSIFPSIRIFSNELDFHIRWAKYWSFSFSISPSNEYSGSPCSPRDSHESSPASQFEGISFLALSLFYCPGLTSIYDFWKNHSFDHVDLCWQSNISAFLKKIILIGG